MKYLFLLLLAGCSDLSHWKLDTLASNEAVFNSSRLVSADMHSHLHLEFLRMGSEIEAFLYLDQHQFAPSPENPQFTEISFREPVIEWQERAPLREGKMRLRLSKKTAERLIDALQNNRDVAILAGGFQETIAASTFKAHYDRFLRGQLDLLRALKWGVE